MEFEFCHLSPRATRVVVEDLSKPRPLESLQLHIPINLHGALHVRENELCLISIPDVSVAFSTSSLIFRPALNAYDFV